MGDGELMQVKAEVDMSAIVSIKIAEIEGRLLKQEQDLQDQIKTTAKSMEDTAASVDGQIKILVEGSIKTKVDIAVEALSAASNDKFSSKIQVSWQYLPKAGEKDTGDDTGIYANVAISSRGACGGTSFVVPIKPTDEITKAITKHHELGEAINGLKEQLVRVRQNLSKMGQAERQIRGQLAKAQLSRSEAGQVILQDLDRMTDIPGLKMLPS